MEEDIKRHMREILWIHYLYDTGVFLSFELLEYISSSLSGKNIPIKNSLLNGLYEATVQNCLSIKKNGNIVFISEHNKYFKTLIKKDIDFLNHRDPEIEKKWVVLPYRNFLPVLENFKIKNKNITFYDIAMELDSEYKKLIMNVYKKKLDLVEEVAQILNFYDKDYFIDDDLYYDDESVDFTDDEEEQEISSEVREILENLQNISICVETDKEIENL